MAVSQFSSTPGQFGMGSCTIAYTGLTASPQEAFIQSANITETNDTAEFKNSNGEIIGKALFNKVQRLEITIMPCATTISGAKANVILPTKGEAVTIANVLHASASVIDGDWNYMEGSVAFSTDGYTQITLTLERYGDSPAKLAAAS